MPEQDVEPPLENSKRADIVGFSEHALDFHGSRPSRQLVKGPYEIPFECLLSREYDNLLVTFRGVSFSSIGASTCRLSPTVMVRGQTAGAAAATYGPKVEQYNATELRGKLACDGITLELQDGYLDAMPNVTPIHDPMW